MSQPQRIVYQLINFSRQEMMFGTTDRPLEEEIERLAKDPAGLTGHWIKDDAVQWRPLSMLLDPIAAEQLRQQLEKSEPPNQFKLLKTPTL